MNSAPPRINTTDNNSADNMASPRDFEGIFADDDSDVSSNVTDDGSGDGGSAEVPFVSQNAATDIENARGVQVDGDWGNRRKSRKEQMGLCAAVCIILLAILAVGLGLGLTMGKGDDTTTDTRGGPSTDPGNDEKKNWTEVSYTPTAAPTIPPVNPDNVMKQPPFGDDLAASIEYHMITQGISELTAFQDRTNEGAGEDVGSEEPTAQAQARDWLFYEDTLPVSIMDEDEEGDSTYDEDAEDDPTAIVDRPNPTNNRPRQKPYLSTSTPAYRVAQRFAAAVLYYAAEGDNWLINQRWLEPGVHECDWIGVTCEDLSIPSITLEDAINYLNEIPEHDNSLVDTTSERMIVAIDLGENNLGGYIPQEIMALPYLQRLGLWSNKLEGGIPTELGTLSRLSSLQLDDNNLKGSIPTQLGQLSELMDLALDYNNGIGGRIPSQLGNLSKLERLRLSNMSLRGAIPKSLGKLTNLKDMFLQNNRLGNKLPGDFSNLVNLESMLLSGNQFTGGLPESWIALVNLKRLEIQSNRMEFDLGELFCELRENGYLQDLKADCAGDGFRTKVTCDCCTECLP